MFFTLFITMLRNYNYVKSGEIFLKKGLNMIFYHVTKVTELSISLITSDLKI